MKVLTVNIPEKWLETMDALIGSEGAYPSRSEIFRAAIREFLLEELKPKKIVDETAPPTPLPDVLLINNESFVNVPLVEGGKEYKQYKIVRKCL